MTSSEHDSAEDSSDGAEDVASAAPRGGLGGLIHVYQKFNPQEIPSPTAPPPDVMSPLFDHLLRYGSARHLTPEELARAVKIDPSQIAGMGPSLDALIAMLEERKRKILDTYETDVVGRKARQRVEKTGKEITVPKPIREAFSKAVKEKQLRELERIWYRVEREDKKTAPQVLKLIDMMGQMYLVDELAAKYEFRGREELSIPRALEVKIELEQIDKLLQQLKEALENAQVGIIDLAELAQFAEPGDIQKLEELQRQVDEYIRSELERQGVEQDGDGYQLTPQAMRTFQGRLLQEIFTDLSAGRTGRHEGPILGEGANETTLTKEYEFGDSLTHLDMPGSFVNAMIRTGGGLPMRMKTEDMVIHRTKNHPKCATVVLMDMSGSMRHGGLYVGVKRMALALDGLIRREYPGDYLQFIEVYSFAKPRHVSEIAKLMPKNPTIFDPVVRLKADMSNKDVSESFIPPHFTNIQRGLQLARRFLATQDTPNKQIVLITDGLPTAHFEGEILYLLYPPDPRTEEATMREARMCAKDGVTMNIFLLPTWSQSEEDVAFAYKMAQSTRGRVFFAAGAELDRFVLHDYVNRRKKIIG